MLNLGDIKTQVSNLIERTDASFLTRIQGYVNQRYRNIAKRRPWMGLCRQITITETVSQNYIILPGWVEQVIDIHQTATPVVLALQRYYNFINRHINDKTDTGDPFVATPVGKIGVNAALPSDGVITIVSSSTSDITQTIRVRGYDTNGTPIDESITLNGTTNALGLLTFASAAGSEPWFTKSADTVGNITIKRGSTTIAYLGTREFEVFYTKWLLHPQPNTANPLYLTVKKKIQLLTQAEDVPEIHGIDDALIAGAYASCLEEKRQFQKGAQKWAQYEEEINLAIGLEPVFQENFQDQLNPEIVRGADDLPYQ